MKQKLDIRESILNAAESLFNENGYFPVSLESVAESADVSKRTLYKYFGDKNGLVKEVLIRRDSYFNDALTNVMAVFSEPKDKINAIVSWHIRWFNSEHYRGCMFLRAQSEYRDRVPEIQKVVREHKVNVKRLILDSLGQGETAEETAHMIMLLLEGMITYTMIFTPKDDSFAVEKKYIFSLVDQALM
ncbi:TetR/AcrR family transcriptional regulator [Neisseria sp. Ec49-e6-T10]|uniref:TetR/AcrR family transcriptional regulator n=1 Tax=Neisseria sp. Ec49-e6-T10 TaxID=3140744 RepID=UPI003EBA4D89